MRAYEVGVGECNRNPPYWAPSGKTKNENTGELLDLERTQPKGKGLNFHAVILNEGLTFIVTPSRNNFISEPSSFGRNYKNYKILCW